jgi:hypothetical protein
MKSLRAGAVLLAARWGEALSPETKMNELFVHDCAGGVHFMPGTMLEGNLNIETVQIIEKQVVGALHDAVKCGCPELTTDDVRDFILPGPQLLLSWLKQDQAARASSSRAVAAKCPLLTSFLGDDLGFNANAEAQDSSEDHFRILPETCSSESWKAGSGCSVQFPMRNILKIDMSLTVTIAQCPHDDAVLPYIAVGCRGKACADWGKMRLRLGLRRRRQQRPLVQRTSSGHGRARVSLGLP